MFMVDDVTYIPAPDFPADIALEGFNIYRDRALLGKVPASASGKMHEFADGMVDEGTHTYHVTALYNIGESQLSNPAEVEIRPLGALESTGDGLVEIRGGRGCAVVTGAFGLAVEAYTPDGRLIFRGQADSDGRAVIPAQPGVCLVKAGSSAAAVIVR